jgi:hypothetical protein
LSTLKYQEISHENPDSSFFRKQEDLTISIVPYSNRWYSDGAG